MIIDADPSGNTCHKAHFNIGGPTTTSRSWDIQITQYACGDTDSSGYDFFLFIDLSINMKYMALKSVKYYPNIPRNSYNF